MRHIAVPGYAASPCNGLIEQITRAAGNTAAAASATAAPRRLPIVGADGRVVRGGVPAEPASVWQCRGCGRTWEREPLPDEAL